MTMLAAFAVWVTSTFVSLKIIEKAANALSGEELKRLSSIRLSWTEFFFALVVLGVTYALITRFPDYGVEIFLASIVVLILEEYVSYHRAAAKLKAERMTDEFMRWFRLANLVSVFGVLAFYAIILNAVCLVGIDGA